MENKKDYSHANVIINSIANLITTAYRERQIDDNTLTIDLLLTNDHITIDLNTRQIYDDEGLTSVEVYSSQSLNKAINKYDLPYIPNDIHSFTTVQNYLINCINHIINHTNNELTNAS